MALTAHHHTHGTIAIPAGEFPRYWEFVHALVCVDKPPGTRVSLAKSLSIAQNLNSIIMEATGSWLWIVSDDLHFRADALTKLLDRDVEVVVPLVIRRGPPFSSLVYKDTDGEGNYQAFGYDELPRDGIVEVVAAGSGGMLIRREVIQAVGPPWFENEPGTLISEDLVFCRKLAECGIPIHLDVDVVMSHISTFAARPSLDDNGWHAELDIGAGPDGRPATIAVERKRG
jgi:GT2 family glycosyltransferase